MKKYVMLFTFTIISAIMIVTMGNFYKQSLIQVSLIKVSPITAENSISCNNGRVERAQTKNVYAPVKAVIKEVSVKPGDKVRRGQTLMTILSVQESDASSGQSYQTYQDLLDSYEGAAGGFSSGIPSSLFPSSSAAEKPPGETEQKITSPSDGTVTSVFFGEQEYADPGKPVIAIAVSSEIQVRLSVNETQISDIKIGQKAVVTGAGFKNTYTGKVTYISSEAQQLYTSTGQETVVEVLVNIENPGTDIKPGFTAKAKIILSESSDVLVAPYEAVRADESGREYVFKLEGKKAVKTPVVTKEEFETGFEIVSGLRKGDEIVANPDVVSDGAFVIPQRNQEVAVNG